MSYVLNRPLFRRLAAVASVTAVVAMTTAAPASAAPPPVSQSTAQAVNLKLLGIATVAVSNPPTAAVNNGGADVTTTAAPAVSLLNGETLLTAGALSETATAQDVAGAGVSYACAGTVQPGGVVQVGSQGTSCTDTGSGPGGASIDLSQLGGATLAGLVDVKLNLNSVTAFAREAPSPTAETDTGTASVTGGFLTVTLAGIPVNVPLTIPAAPNSNLLTSVVNGLTAFVGLNPLDAPLLDPLIAALTGPLVPILELCTNYQPSLPLNGAADCRGANGTVVPVTPATPFSVSGIHVSLLNTAGAVADISRVTVGPNIPAPSTSAFPTEGLPIAAGAGLLAVALVVPWYRRRRRAMTSAA